MWSNSRLSIKKTLINYVGKSLNKGSLELIWLIKVILSMFI
jgi:hypothetical protein